MVHFHSKNFAGFFLFFSREGDICNAPPPPLACHRILGPCWSLLLLRRREESHPWKLLQPPRIPRPYRRHHRSIRMSLFFPITN